MVVVASYHGGPNCGWSFGLNCLVRCSATMIIESGTFATALSVSTRDRKGHIANPALSMHSVPDYC